VYRTTAGRRFQTLDAFLAPILETHFGGSTWDPNHLLLAEDWAASACITSVEWFESLNKSFPGAVRLTASDLHLDLIEMTLPSGATFIVEAGGQPLQYIHPPFVIPLSRPEPTLLAVNRWMQKRAQRRFEELKQQGIVKSVTEDQGREQWKAGAVTFRKIPLVHPRALALQHAEPRFIIKSQSVFDVLSEPCHLIRTMNILNVFYFDKDRLMDAVRAVWHSLQVNGIWMVGRTIEERTGQTPALHHASVFEKVPAGFRLLERHIAPSEIEDLGLALRI
jgi:hypothetical protein